MERTVAAVFSRSGRCFGDNAAVSKAKTSALFQYDPVITANRDLIVEATNLDPATAPCEQIIRSLNHEGAKYPWWLSLHRLPFTGLIFRGMDMDFNSEAGPSRQDAFGGGRDSNDNRGHPSNGGVSFEIFEWYPSYQSCQRHFLDNAQHNTQVQTLAAFLNILLPCQRRSPTMSSKPSSPQAAILSVSLIPYIRRLVATGFDNPSILHGFFGSDWKQGVGSLHEVERRNYLFAAKSGSWLEVKASYDISEYETVPFLKPLHNPTEEEISMADKQWSEWLAMQDWMVGPRAPDAMTPSARIQSPRIKRESRG